MFKHFFNDSPTSKYQKAPFAHKFQFLTALKKSKTLAVLGRELLQQYWAETKQWAPPPHTHTSLVWGSPG